METALQTLSLTVSEAIYMCLIILTVLILIPFFSHEVSRMRFIPLLSICFNGFLIHVFLPDTMISMLLVLVIKDKSGKVGCSGNYRPIAIASVQSKVFESILLDRI